MTPDKIPNYQFLLTILIIILNGCAISSSDDKQKLFQDLASKTIKSGIKKDFKYFFDINLAPVLLPEEPTPSQAIIKEFIFFLFNFNFTSYTSN